MPAGGHISLEIFAALAHYLTALALINLKWGKSSKVWVHGYGIV